MDSAILWQNRREMKFGFVTWLTVVCASRPMKVAFNNNSAGDSSSIYREEQFQSATTAYTYLHD